MTDDQHAAVIKKAAEHLQSAIEEARANKVFTRVVCIHDESYADWQPTIRVEASVIKAL